MEISFCSWLGVGIGRGRSTVSLSVLWLSHGWEDCVAGCASLVWVVIEDVHMLNRRQGYLEVLEEERSGSLVLWFAQAEDIS